MLKKHSKKIIEPLLALGLLFSSFTQASVIQFNYNQNEFDNAPNGALALAGFEQAANFWESVLIDDATVNITIGFSSLDPGVLAQAGSERGLYFYDDVKQALENDVSSANDQVAVDHLECTTFGTSQCNITFADIEQDANGDFVSVIDADGSIDNQTVALTTANAKALGFTSDVNNKVIDETTNDATITFSSDFDFDFDLSDGIGAGLIDFVGVAVHEIGHALGFVSGVDTYDQFLGQDLDGFVVANTLDLFRYTAVSASLGIKDFRPFFDSYFSLDGGETAIAPFSTGAFNGDGQQASHWKDNLDIGALDPTAANGELVDVTPLDLLAFDVIGWDLSQEALLATSNIQVQAVPEPETMALFGLALLLIAQQRRKLIS